MHTIRDNRIRAVNGGRNRIFLLRFGQQPHRHHRRRQQPLVGHCTTATRITDPSRNVWTSPTTAATSRRDHPKATTSAAQYSGQIVARRSKGNARIPVQHRWIAYRFTDALGNKWTYDYDGAAAGPHPRALP
jgi:hypothetical protein